MSLFVTYVEIALLCVVSLSFNNRKIDVIHAALFSAVYFKEKRKDKGRISARWRLWSWLSCIPTPIPEPNFESR